MSARVEEPAVPVEAPTVRLPKAGLSGAAIGALGVVAAALLFVALDARRQGQAASPVTGPRAAFVPPPPLALPPQPAVTERPALPPATPLPPVVIYRQPSVSAASPPVIVPDSSPAPLIVPIAPSSLPPASAVREDRVGRASPLPSPFVVDTAPGAGEPVANTGRGPQPQLAGTRPPGTGGDNAAARASSIANRSDTVPIGTMIPIVLETPIDTARPGLVRGVTSVDTRGFDGRRVLIPRGSRLIGEYQADVRPGQNRVLVNWTRLVRPDGVTVQLSSPAADALGGAGVPGRVHSFFLERFAGALLQSALTVGVNLASRPRAGSVVVGLPSGPITTVGQGLVPTNDLRPKITVRQGAVLNVFVARDLDFSAPEAGGGR